MSDDNNPQSIQPHGDTTVLSLLDASRRCDYSQEYLRLLARKGTLAARKIGRNWFTTEEALRDYLRTHSLISAALRRSASDSNQNVPHGGTLAVSLAQNHARGVEEEEERSALLREFARLNPQFFDRDRRPAPPTPPPTSTDDSHPLRTGRHRPFAMVLMHHPAGNISFSESSSPSSLWSGGPAVNGRVACAVVTHLRLRLRNSCGLQRQLSRCVQSAGRAISPSVG